MDEKKFGQLLELAYQAVRPHHGPGALPLLMVIRYDMLQMIIPGKQRDDDILIMLYTKEMLTKGLTGAQWDTLQKNLIKHQKEIKN